MPPLKLPLALEPYSALPKQHVAVWFWSGDALDAGDEAAGWFSSFLKIKCRVVRFHLGETQRPTDAQFAPGFQTSFSDRFPFLVVSKASLDSLNQKLASPVPINRFRPNILMDGCEAYEEDKWRVFKIGEAAGREFKGVRPCDRCKVPTIDQATAETGTEPAEALKEFRNAKVLDLPNTFDASSVFFGMHAVCVKGDGSTVAVGDQIHVTTLAETPGSLLGSS